MSYLDYYQYQNQARGIRSLADIARMGEARSYLYDRLVLSWLPADRSSLVAELACGHGSFLYWLRARGFGRLTGIDSSPEQVQLARLVGVPIAEANVLRWLEQQPENHCAALVAIDLIEHLTRDEFMDLLRLAYRVLEPGGRLLLRCPNGESPIVGHNLFNDITHLWTYTPNCLQSLAAMHGYASAAFRDESSAAIRDHRWLKIPVSKISAAILGFLIRAATREKVRFWSPHLWACLCK